MGGQTISTSATRAEALQIQSSVRGACIPWVRGRTRFSGNLLFAAGFTAVAHTESDGGKGGANVRNTSYTYHVDAMMGLCHGPIIGLPTVWRGKAVFYGGVLPTQIENASEAWTVPAAGAMTRTLANAAGFLCILAVTRSANGLMLAQGRHYTVAANGVLTVLDEALRGVALAIAYQWRNTTITHGALSAMGLSFIGGHIGQATWSGLSGYPTEAIGYSGLAAVAGQDYDLGSSASFENHTFEVVAPMAYHLGQAQPDIDPSLFCRELLVDARAGASFPYGRLGTWSRWSDYCVAAGLLVSPRLTTQTTAAQVLKTAADLTNSAIVTSSGVIELVPYADQPESGNGRTFTPDLTPAYDLNDNCWVPGGAGESPLKYRLKTSADRYNHWRLDFANRANAYESEPAEAKDDADIQARGLRTNPNNVNAADWVCAGTTARKAVQVLMQRSISVLNEYEAPLPWHFSLLDLMDVVTLTNEELKLDRWPARVIGINENEEGDLVFTFEDCPIGAASAATYGPPDGLGYAPDYNAQPGDVAPPLVFEGPAALAGGTGIEVCVAVRGTGPNWGGADIWTSLDGSNYRRIATVWGAARYGQLSAALSSGAGSLAVDGLGAAQLLSGSPEDADQLVTLCYVGGASVEFLAYETATLTGAGAYTLGGLVRGAHGSPAAAHADNAPFCRIDAQVARSGPLEASMVGQALYIKCTSFNLVGMAPQSLADVDPVVYTVTGIPAGYTPGNKSLSSALTSAAVTLAADASGVVTSYAGAQTRHIVEWGGADDSAAWSYSAAASTGLTASLGTGADKNLLTITNMTAPVDSGYVDMTATKPGFPDQVRRYSVSKNRSAPGASGVTNNWWASCGSSDLVPPYSMSASITMSADGSMSRSGSPAPPGGNGPEGNWFTPTTSGVGSGYQVRFRVKAGATPTGALMNTWLSFPRTLTLAGSGNEYSLVEVTVRDATTEQTLGGGTIHLEISNGM